MTMAEFDGQSTKYGNDASSNEDLNLKWGFNLSDDVSPEEPLELLQLCV